MGESADLLAERAVRCHQSHARYKDLEAAARVLLADAEVRLLRPVRSRVLPRRDRPPTAPSALPRVDAGEAVDNP